MSRDEPFIHPIHISESRGKNYQEGVIEKQMKGNTDVLMFLIHIDAEIRKLRVLPKTWSTDIQLSDVEEDLYDLYEMCKGRRVLRVVIN